MTSRWADRVLRSEGAAVNAAGTSTPVSESYSLNGDGSVLTVEITVATPEQKTSTLKYVRITSVGPCESWPTPCKRGG